MLVTIWEHARSSGQDDDAWISTDFIINTAKTVRSDYLLIAEFSQTSDGFHTHNVWICCCFFFFYFNPVFRNKQIFVSFLFLFGRNVRSLRRWLKHYVLLIWQLFLGVLSPKNPTKVKTSSHSQTCSALFVFVTSTIIIVLSTVIFI